MISLSSVLGSASFLQPALPYGPMQTRQSKHRHFSPDEEDSMFLPNCAYLPMCLHGVTTQKTIFHSMTFYAKDNLYLQMFYNTALKFYPIKIETNSAATWLAPLLRIRRTCFVKHRCYRFPIAPIRAACAQSNLNFNYCLYFPVSSAIRSKMVRFYEVAGKLSALF
jgi:hypothetical protein